ncbi:SapC family protein [Noviherbaspirillum sp. Root189]|uniref:SapC family protein n=1 Tax=Noviherbaspirillum sp. Root189 TaxID=1736487 RepID=UPI00070ECD6D|nr:SapC family protein [Noviherbaspirillum sp. Root189]KRB77649.1 hypothetical protein ASE07_26240 [Noviherbaspirillum sp. Root189]
MLPALDKLEAFFLTIRAQVDPELQRAQPVKLGKPYPLGQCLEITLTVEKRLRRPDISSLGDLAAQGYAAFSAFQLAGGSFRQVWGDLRGEFFQNAFQLGTLYVDVSNDTVTPTKPKVEILPFEKARFAAIADFQHFSRIAARYWGDTIFPNHVLPELAPYCPLVHISPVGVVCVRNATPYMVGLTQAGKFKPSEEVLCGPAMPTALFDYVAQALTSTKLKLAASPEEGRTHALRLCREYRAKRVYGSQSQTNRVMATTWEVNHQLIAASIKRGAFKMKSSAVSGTAEAEVAPQYIPISKTQHASKRWRRSASYHFAAGDAVIPLGAEELPKAMMAMPLGFVASEEGFTPVAVQGLASGENLFVTRDGSWASNYIPAIYRGYPFTLANTETGQQVLCIDQTSGLVVDGTQGELFFNDDGTPGQAVKGVFDMLTRVHADRESTARICAVLQKHRLIEPWLIKVQSDDGERSIEGLFRIDEVALNALPIDALEEVRKAGALPVAYCQLLSMQHLPALAQLAQARRRP